MSTNLSHSCARTLFGLSLLTIAFFAGCSSKPTAKSVVPKDSPRPASIHFEYAIYLPKNQKDALSTARDLIARKYPEFKLVDEIPKEPKSMLVHVRLTNSAQKDYAPPNMACIRSTGEGVTEEQGMALQKVNSALILEFAHPKQHVWTALKRATVLLEELGHTQGLLWDDETRQVFTANAWRKKRLEGWTGDIPVVSTQTVVHVYSTGEYVRGISLGMSKMGLPDVVVQEFPWSSEGQVGSLIDDFTQTLAEGPIPAYGKFKLDLRNILNSSVREKGLKALYPTATGTACLTLKPGKWEDGDPKNQIIELGSDAYPGNDPNAQQEYMLSALFGSADTLSNIDYTDEVLAASAKAKAQLPELQKAFKTGLQPGEYLLVKAPFEYRNGNEWMWVEVTAWNENDIKGTLENEPAEALYLHPGQIVHVREDDVFDYIRHYPDKHEEGNTTGAIMAKMEKKDGKQNSTVNRQVPACK